MEEKIRQLEDEIGKLHLDNRQEINRYFWDYHIRPVIRISRRMAEKHGADEEVLWLAAMLHDISKLDDDSEPHDELSSGKARDILIKNGFGEEMAQKVSDTILTHRCRKYPPESLEQRILASADALSHFESPFHFWFLRFTDKELNKAMKDSAIKNDRDFEEKILFEEEKESVRNEYEILKKWFNYNI